MDTGHDGRAEFVERRDQRSREALVLSAAAVLSQSAGATITQQQVPLLCGLPNDVGARVVRELVARGILAPLPRAEAPGGNRWRQSNAFLVQRQ